MIISAQPKNFSGNWKLDTKSPHLGPDFLTMNVSQNATELEMQIITKIGESTDTETRSYNLDGRQTFRKADADTGKVEAALNVNVRMGTNQALVSN